MHPAREPRRARLRLAGVCLLVAVFAPSTFAQAPAGEVAEGGEKVSVWAERKFTVPFQLDPQAVARVKELRLWQKDGAEWRWVKVAAPTDRGFDCSTDRDGTFLFGVQAQATDGNLVPPVDQLRPTLRVVVDTQAPVVTLKAVRQDGPGGVKLIGVTWEVFDTTLNLTSLRADFRLVDQRTNTPGEWQPLTGVDQRAKWQRLWEERPNTHLEVRLQVQDHFKRTGEATVLVSNLPGANLGGTAGTFGPETPPKGTGTAKPPANVGGVPVIYRNKISFTLKFRVARTGPSGLQDVSLYWCTPEGPYKVAEQPDGKFAREMDESGRTESVMLRFEAPSEGRYGFVLVGVSGSGVRNREIPKKGDTPDLWAEVVVKPPVIKKFDVKTGKGPEARKLTITWQVDDKHLRDDPIQLEYAAKEDAENWEPIAYNLPNTGKYEWVAPDREPYNFVVRMRVIDRATNEASASVPGIIVDPTPPEIKFMDVTDAEEPGKSPK
jgi:hypothetical protein